MYRRSLIGCVVAAVTAGCSGSVPTGSTDQPGANSEKPTEGGVSKANDQSDTYAGVEFEGASIEFSPESIAQIERIVDQTKVHKAVEEYDKFLEGYSLDLVLSEAAQTDAATFNETQKERYYEQVRSVEGRIREKLGDDWPQIRYYGVVDGESVFDHEREQFQYQELIDNRITVHGLAEDDLRAVANAFGYRIDSQPASPETVELVFTTDRSDAPDDIQSAVSSSSNWHRICDGSEFTSVAGPFLGARRRWSLDCTLSETVRDQISEIAIEGPPLKSPRNKIYMLLDGEPLNEGGFNIANTLGTSMAEGEWDGTFKFASQSGLWELSARLSRSMTAEPN